MIAAGGEVLAAPVLVLAPTAKDSLLTESILARADIPCHCFKTLTHLCTLLDGGAGAVLLPEEMLGDEREGCLLEWLRRQPPWSDLPVLVLARPGADSTAVSAAMELLGNVTVLERPMRVAALVSAVRTALRARQRQFQIRAHLDQQLLAEVELRENDRRKDEFLAMLAHELRNPLAPIRNSLHILRLTGQKDPSTARLGEMMERQVNHMVRLVDDLMEVSRITRGKIELHHEPMDLAAVVRSAVETSRPLIDAARHHLRVTTPDHPLMLLGDPVRLAQVMANLLNNAAKYTEPGGRIWLDIRQEQGWAVLVVRDTGVGIAPDMLPRVFEMFTQIDTNADRSQGGLGIGLTLVKRLVELHGGTVAAHSGGPGRGSEFIVRLPLATAKLTLPDRRAVPGNGLAPRRVLVVDDNHDAAESLGTLLQLLGAEVRIVYSGPEAQLVFPTYQPAVVVLDIGMPGMTGHEVVRWMRLRPEGRDVTFIALTGWGQEEDRHRSQLAGFDHHLVKPANVDELQALLSSLESPALDR